jgi:Cu/Ag efflux pump CusA
MMTSLAFVLGVDPLALAVGAGAEMRRTLGIADFSGMLGVTLFGVFVTPVFYYVLEKLAREGPKTPAMPEAAHADHSAGDAAHVTRA